MPAWRNWFGRKLGLTDPEPWAYAYGAPSAAGKSVNDTNALTLSATWACIKSTAEAIGNLPLRLHQVGPDGSRAPATDHPVAQVLANPNAEMTGVEFWSAMTAWLLSRGNAFAMIERSGQRIVALTMIPADIMSVIRDTDWNLRYRFTHQNKAYDLSADEVLHVKGFGYGGDLGLSPISYGAQTLGSALAADETAGKIFANGLMPSGLITTDNEIAEEQRDQLTALLNQYVGSTHAGKMMILEAGLKFDRISISPEDMQMIESRRFDVEQICRIFGVPPIVIGHASEGTTSWGSGIESLYLQWLQTGLDPIMTRIESRIIKQLFPASERMKYIADFERGNLIRTDSAARASYLSTVVQNGLMTRNEGRRLLNLPPKAGGDDLTVQTALAPIDKLPGGSNEIQTP